LFILIYLIDRNDYHHRPATLSWGRRQADVRTISSYLQKEPRM